MLQEILDLVKKRCEQAEVYRIWQRDTPANFEANRLKLLETKEISGVALRLVKDGRIGFSATNDLGDVRGLIDRALELAPFGAQAKFTLPSAERLPEVSVYDPATERVTVEEMVEIGQTMIDELRKANANLVCEAGVSVGTGVTEIANSNGGHASYRHSSYSLGLHGTLIRGTDMLFVGDWGASCRPDLDAKAITDRVKRQLEMAMETVPAPIGDVPVVFTPRAVAGSVLSPLMSAVNGRTVLQGASPLQGKLGKNVLDERISIWDDATVDMRPASRIVDDEGVPSRRITLFDHGVPTAFLYDLQTAGLAGTKTTGSASRGLGSLPSPSSSLLLMAPGKTPFDDIVAGVDDGVLVESLLGAGQGNVLGGDFGGNVLLGYRIQQGKITGRVKDTMINGNVYDALNKLIALGDTAEWVGGSLSLPALCCRGVTVSAKS
ncbi:MAG: TldD/PmbA family protein [Chloroflexi bacterium]|nr:TldD/PmbA family protein [Chloroflexota bacterium]